MATRTTKLELEQQLIAKGQEIEALRAKYLELRAAYKGAIDKVEELTRPAARSNVKPAYVSAPRVLPAHMVAARELAMRTGTVVRV